MSLTGPHASGGSQLALSQALDHTPAIAVVDASRADHGMHIGSACIAAGFRVVAVSMDTPQALDILASIMPRPEMVVGCSRVGSAAQAEAAVAAGARFLMAPTRDDSVGGIAAEAGSVWIPGAMTPSEVAACLASGASTVQLFPAGTLGPLHLRMLAAAFSGLECVAAGGIGGDRIGEWIAAGARAVALSEALYSPALLAKGDRMAIRNYAAAAHQEATRHSIGARQGLRGRSSQEAP